MKTIDGRLVGLPYRKRNRFLKVLNDRFYDLPCPLNLNAWWRFGSILGLCLGIQVITGVLLAFHYTPHVDIAYDSVIHIIRNVKKGWILRSSHANGASIYFICIYIHIGRGIYYGSYLDKKVWNVGIILYFLIIGEAFFGYSLPWGQISYWGVTVITNFLTVLPKGKELLHYVWGGWTVCDSTLKRFYTLHIILPFLIFHVILLHLLFLHDNGSNNPLGVESDIMSITFHPWYTVKDLFGFVCFSWVYIYLVTLDPELLGNPVNYIPADTMKTPFHIKPEWYFIWAYTILRSVPWKGPGVASMFIAILVLFFLPYLHNGYFRRIRFYPVGQIMFWGLVATFFGLTWIGNSYVRYPYVEIGRFYRVMYFSLMFFMPTSLWFWDELIRK